VVEFVCCTFWFSVIVCCPTDDTFCCVIFSSWDSHHHAKRHKIHDKDVRYHGSADSLYIDSKLSSIAGSTTNDVELQCVEDSFVVQCNQIFIGMITMQYQAKQVCGHVSCIIEVSCSRYNDE
jgi:hypothetical protein